MDARWKGIPFRANSGPVSPVLDEEPPYGDMDPDPRQDAGLYSAYSEHDHGSIAPESLGPPQCIGRITTQPATRKDPTNIEEVKHPPDVQTAKPRRRIWRILRRYWICILAMVMILGLALGLGLGLTIGRNVQGAMEGTGLAALDLRDGSSKITLYFQDRSGHIRVSQYENGVWTGGTSQDTVVTYDARSGTPLMALSYAHDDELTWRVFYIDRNDVLQESLNSNKSTGWSSGLLGTSNFKASSSPNVGLTACYNYHWYGNPFGLRLYYGSAEGSVQELTWNFGAGAWTKGYTFPGSNPHGGCECTVRGSSITSLWLLNTKGELEERWREFNLSANSSNHPAGTWIKQLTYTPILPNTSISAINYATTKNVHFQSPTNAIIQLIATGAAETSTWDNQFQVGSNGNDKVLGRRGTKIGSVVLNTTEGGQEIHVFFQEEGKDGGRGVVDMIRTLVGGTWSKVRVPIGK